MRWIALALLLAGGAFNVHGATVQARLIRATHEAQATDAPLKDIEPELKKKFGYKFYRQMGVQKQVLQPQTPHRLDVGQGFVVTVTERAVDKSTHQLEVEWFSGKTSLVKLTARIAEKGTLFFKGPAVGNDWIVLALTVQ